QDGSAVLCSPVHRSAEQRAPDAAPTVLAPHHEAGHPPCTRVIVKNPGQCPIGGDPRKRRAGHDPGPADHLVAAVGQQADGLPGVLDLTLERALVVGLLVAEEPLAPARVAILLPRPEGPPQVRPPLSCRRHYPHHRHPLGTSSGRPSRRARCSGLLAVIVDLDECGRPPQLPLLHHPVGKVSACPPAPRAQRTAPPAERRCSRPRRSISAPAAPSPSRPPLARPASPKPD